VLLELGPFLAGGCAQLAVGAAAFYEGFVAGDEVLGEHGGVAAVVSRLPSAEPCAASVRQRD
jgi:hypothetical protein